MWIWRNAKGKSVAFTLFQSIIIAGIQGIDRAQLRFYTQEMLFSVAVEQNPLVKPGGRETVVADAGIGSRSLIEAIEVSL